MAISAGPFSKLARILVYSIGCLVLIAFMVPFGIVMYATFREGGFAAWANWKKELAGFLYIATGLVIGGVTVSNVQKKLNVPGDMQFAILLAYLFALAVWGVVCFLPIYLFLGR